MQHTKPSALLSEALSTVPLVSELEARWREVCLEENYVPLVELPEMCLQDHVIGSTGRHINYEITIDGRTRSYAVATGESLIIPAQQAFTMRVDHAHVSRALHLSPSLLTRNALELWDADDYELIESHQVKDPLIQHMRAALRAELNANSDGCDIYAQTMGNALAVHLLSRYSSRTKLFKLFAGGLSPRDLKHVVEFIGDNLSQELNLTDLANTVQLSQYHFAHAFKQSMGISPHQYVIQQRIARAMILLRQATVSIHAISRACGFTSPSHFSKSFRKRIGLSPSQFRRSGNRMT